MKRFFTKKSVAIIFATILLVGLFSFNSAAAYSNYIVDYVPNPPVLDTGAGTHFQYIGNKLWKKAGETTGLLYKETAIFPNGTPAGWLKEEAKVDAGGGIDTNQTPEEAPSNWFGLKTLFGYGVGLLSFYAGTGEVIGFLKLLSMALSAIVALSAFIFDQSITLAILHTKEFFDSTGAVNFIWTMMRDLLNITFIFILLYEAIAKIIGSWGVKSKTTLLNVIISAIFINFSMLIAKILIDAGNMVAVQLYSSILSIGPAGFSSLLLGQLGLTAFASSAFSLTGQLNQIISNSLAITLDVVLIYVFLFGAFVLIGRVVMLVLLTMTSPIGFVGKSVPILGEYSTAWWKSFIDQIIVAPALMFVLFIVTKILANKGLTSAINGSKASMANSTLDTSSFLLYIIIIILLLKGMKFVKEKSGEVAGTIIKATTVAAVGAAAVVTGGAALGATGLVSSEGALAAANAAKLAGKGTVGQWGARLAFSAKNIPESISNAGPKHTISNLKQLSNTGVGKFITGDYEKTGASGLVQGMARDKIIGGLKDATTLGGFKGVDLSAIEKTLKKSKEDAEKNISKQADKVGPQKAIDREKELIDIENNIKQQAERRIDAAERKNMTEEQYATMKKQEGKEKNDNDEDRKKMNALANAKKEKDKEVKESLQNMSKLSKGSPEYITAVKEHAEKVIASDKATADFTTAESKVKAFENKEKTKANELKKEMEKVAEEIGIAETEVMEDVLDAAGNPTLDKDGKKIKRSTGIKSRLEKIKQEREELVKKIEEGTKARNEYIAKLEKEGTKLSTLLWEGDRKKLVEKLRAQKGKYNADKENLGKNITKALKDAGIELPNDDKKQEKPKDGSDNK